MFYTIMRSKARESSVALPAQFLRDFDRLPTELKLNVESKLNLIPSSPRHWKSRRQKQKAHKHKTRHTILDFLVTTDFQWQSHTMSVTSEAPGVKDDMERRRCYSSSSSQLMVFSWIINWTVCSFLDCTITKTLVNNSAATPVIYSCYAANGSFQAH